MPWRSHKAQSTMPLSILLTLLIAGCGASTATPKYVEASLTKQEYLDEAKQLRLAPGWAWPSSPSYQDRADDGKKNMYEINAGRVDAAWYWHCSWARTFFRAADSADRSSALAEVLRLRESAFYKWGLDEHERDARDKVLDDARAGKTAALKEIVDLNCPERPK